ncbi:MAG: hypothetical protein RLZ98_2744 [Pseudomonadota bacterium]
MNSDFDEKPGSERPRVPLFEGRAERWIEEKPAFALFREMQLQLPCMIIDMSAVGACIGLPREGDADYVDPETLPASMMLDLRAEATEVECEIVWRSASRLGLRFLSSPQPY